MSAPNSADPSRAVAVVTAVLCALALLVLATAAVLVLDEVAPEPTATTETP